MGQKIMDETRITHLTFLQGVIARMNANSFAIKGFAIAITGGALGTGVSAQQTVILCLGIALVSALWLLNAMYLHMERAYRAVYDLVRKKATVSDFEMSLKSFKENGEISPWPCFLGAFLSTTLLCIYPPAIIFLAAVVCWMSVCIDL